MGGIGGPELLLVFLVVLLVFGPKKIPEVSRALGRGLREIRRLSTDLQREINLVPDEKPDARAITPRPSPSAGRPRPASGEPSSPCAPNKPV